MPVSAGVSVERRGRRQYLETKMTKLWCMFNAVTLLLLGAAAPVRAQDPAGEESQATGRGPTGKIGFVDLDRITAKARQQAAAMDSLSDEVRKIQRDVQEKLDKIRDLEREIMRSEGVLSADEISRRRREVNRLKDELDGLERQYRQKMQRLDETVFEPLVKKIGYAIEDEAKEKGFDIVLRGEAVFYGNPAVDLTEAVIQRLDRDFESSRAKGESAQGAAAGKSSAPDASADRTASSSKTDSASGSKSASSSSRVRPVDRQKDR